MCGCQETAEWGLTDSAPWQHHKNPGPTKGGVSQRMRGTGSLSESGDLQAGLESQEDLPRGRRQLKGGATHPAGSSLGHQVRQPELTECKEVRSQGPPKSPTTHRWSISWWRFNSKRLRWCLRGSGRIGGESQWRCCPCIPGASGPRAKWRRSLSFRDYPPSALLSRGTCVSCGDDKRVQCGLQSGERDLEETPTKPGGKQLCDDQGGSEMTPTFWMKGEGFRVARPTEEPGTR